MTVTDRHVWRTVDGRHVPDGHPDAAFLAYPAGDDLPADVAAELVAATAKAKAAPADKARTKPADK